MTLLLVTIGLVTLLGQVVLLRELLVAFFGSELVYVLAIGCWLIGSAAGALLGGRVVPGKGSSPDHDAGKVRRRTITWLLIALAIVMTVGMVTARALGLLFGGVPGADLALGAQLAGMGLVLLPASFLAGTLMRLAARAAIAQGDSLIRAYAIESGGGALGGILATVFLAWGISNFSTGLWAGLLAVGVATLSAWKKNHRWSFCVGTLVAAGLLAALFTQETLDHRLTRWNHSRLVETRDTPYGRITVTVNAGQVALFEDGALVATSEGTAAEEFVQLAGIQRSVIDSVLVLGLGTGGEVANILAYRPARLDWVVPDTTALRWLAGHLPGRIGQALAAPEVNLSEYDPRAWLENAGHYDLILTAMPEPSSGRTNRFYTREFFELCRQHLRPRGVLALRLAASENVWTPARRARAASVIRALAVAFGDEVVILPGQASYVLLASPEPFDRDPALLAARLADDGGELQLVSPAYVRYLYTSDRYREAKDLLAATEVPLNRDVRPACYAYTQVIWLSRLLPDLMWRDTSAKPGRLLFGWVLVVLIAGGILARLVRHRERAPRIMLAGVAGLTGIVLEAIVLLHYQVHRGVLYRDLGLLLTAFMVGLALGGAVLARAREPGRSVGVVILVGLTLLAGFAAWGTAVGLAPGWPAALVLMLAAGFLTSALLGFASRVRRPPEAPLVGPLFAADLFGGCLGSVVATLFLIPVLGLPGAAAVLLVPILLAAALVL